MFDRIARRYDLVNTVLSAGTDGGWRRKAAQVTQLKAGGTALDVACGSGKLTAQLARIAGPAGRVVGLDFSPKMLDVARSEHPGVEFLEGDALKRVGDEARGLVDEALRELEAIELDGLRPTLVSLARSAVDRTA